MSTKKFNAAILAIAVVITATTLSSNASADTTTGQYSPRSSHCHTGPCSTPARVRETADAAQSRQITGVAAASRTAPSTFRAMKNCARCGATTAHESRALCQMHILEQREHPFWVNVNSDSEGT